MAKGRITVTNHSTDGVRVDLELPAGFLAEVDTVSKQLVAGAVLSNTWGAPTPNDTRHISQVFATQILADAFVTQVQADLAGVVARKAKIVTRTIDIDL